MRRVRHLGSPEIKYAMPVSHSHQFLCVLMRPLTTTVTRSGFDGSVTSQISCAVSPNERSRYTLLLSARGRSRPSHTRPISAPPASPCHTSPGVCMRYFGHLVSVTSTIEVSLLSGFAVSGLGC